MHKWTHDNDDDRRIWRSMQSIDSASCIRTWFLRATLWDSMKEMPHLLFRAEFSFKGLSHANHGTGVYVSFRLKPSLNPQLLYVSHAVFITISKSLPPIHPPPWGIMGSMRRFRDSKTGESFGQRKGVAIFEKSLTVLQNSYVSFSARLPLSLFSRLMLLMANVAEACPNAIMGGMAFRCHNVSASNVVHAE